MFLINQEKSHYLILSDYNMTKKVGKEGLLLVLFVALLIGSFFGLIFSFGEYIWTGSGGLLALIIITAVTIFGSIGGIVLCSIKLARINKKLKNQ
ncbi:MAG: hypothetical protein HeimAB125_22740 [Candidatus Heimdallarchaeota archaeon AB_125]|nr:MAG: hypothetical protein HeimAB125_22740 [Candidatus Heimdallarchaeota archaeon AB_125]